MKKLFATALVAASLAACASLPSLPSRHSNPYEKPLFYSRYLNPNSPLDRQIQRTVDALRANPDAASLHNDLGQLLAQKGFPKDATVEFERAVEADRKFYPGWYNLGLMHASTGDNARARRDFAHTLSLKPGNAVALFQLGLMEEMSGNRAMATEHYAKAFSINRTLLDVRVNPRILDSKLIDEALIVMYPKEHTRQSMQFQGRPSGWSDRQIPAIDNAPQAPSPQAPTSSIVTPAAPVTDPARQTPAPQGNQPPAVAPIPPNARSVPAGTPAGTQVIVNGGSGH